MAVSIGGGAIAYDLSMELRHIASFVAVAQELHFGLAARRLHLAQPAVTHHVQRLETELGVKLLERTTRAVSLTEVGMAFLEEALATIAQAERAATVAKRAARGELGRLRVGHVGLACYSITPQILRAFHAAAPDVQILLKEGTSGTQVRALQDGELDIGFVRPPVPDDRLVADIVRTERIVVALADSHRLAGNREVPASALADEVVVLYPRVEDANMHDRVLEVCAEAGFSPQVEPVSPMTSVVIAVAAGLGVSLVPTSVASHFHPPGVCYRPLGESTKVLQLAVVRRRTDQSPVVETFCQLAWQVARRCSGR